MKKQKRPFIVNVLILTAVTTICWVAFDIYRAFTVKPAPILSEAILAPFSPELSSAVLDDIQNKVYFSETEISNTLP